MPKETDRERLDLLDHILRDTASNVVVFSRRAWHGSDEPNDPGLHSLMPADLTEREKGLRLKHALAAFIRDGGRPNRLDYTYEDRDPETIYEFRLRFCDRRVYVKTQLLGDDPDDPGLLIRSVKLQD